MTPRSSIWLAAIQWLIPRGENLPKVWPEDLGPGVGQESGSRGQAFWMNAVRPEMAGRDELSAKIRANGYDPDASAPDLTPLEGWWYRRRTEWEVFQATEQASDCDPVPESEPLSNALDWLLVESWNTH